MSEEERVKYNFQPELEYVLAQDPFCIKIHVQNIDEWTKPSYERCKWAADIIFAVILPHISNNMIRKWIGPTPSREEFASLLELTHGIYHPTGTRRKKIPCTGACKCSDHYCSDTILQWYDITLHHLYAMMAHNMWLYMFNLYYIIIGIRCHSIFSNCNGRRKSS